MLMLTEKATSLVGKRVQLSEVSLAFNCLPQLQHRDLTIVKEDTTQFVSNAAYHGFRFEGINCFYDCSFFVPS